MHLHNPGENLGIGTPIPNTTAYLLDEHMMPVKIGSVGVIWAGGCGITRGYVNNTIKTNETYLRDPFMNDGYVHVDFPYYIILISSSSSMMFNTGELA
jgi:non-ribosomal peptide synthetase component F